MLTANGRTVNVNRLALLDILRKNKEIHIAEYAEALIEFKRRLLEDLTAAVDLVADTAPEKLNKFSIRIAYPQNHESDYQEVIDMLEVSVDATIQLDVASFRSYYKNEWSWSGAFNATKSLYASGSFVSNAGF